MLTLAVALLLQSVPDPDASAVLRTVEIAVTDENGEPVAGLIPEELVVLENGVAREVAEAEPDDRPLVLAVIVDSSQAVSSSYRLNIVPAVSAFLQRLPPRARYTLWVTGDRPERRVGPTDDAALGVRSLERVVPQGGSTMLDALVEASRELKAEEGERKVVVAVASEGTEFSSRERRQVVRQAEPNADLFEVVQFREGASSLDMRAAYGYAFDELTERTGGLYETPVSVLALESALKRVSGDIASRYRVSYATLDSARPEKLEVQVARPGVRVRVTDMPEVE